MRYYLLLALILAFGCAERKIQSPPAQADNGLCQRDYFTEAEAKEIHARWASELKTLSDWQKRAKRIKRGIIEGARLDSLPARTPLNPIRHSRREMEGYAVENFAIESQPGLWVTGNIYSPLKQKPPYAGILSPHGHWSEPEDYGRFREDMQMRCAALARMGAVVLAYDMNGYGESDQLPHKHPEAVRIQTWNSIRLLDYLESKPEVDPARLGVTGASGGGTQSFLLTALDDRVAVSVPTVMVSGHFFGGCACESGMPIHRSTDHQTSNVEIAALAAPRPMMLISDGDDWTSNTPDFEFPYIKRIYDFFGFAERVENVHLQEEKHDYGPNKRKAMYPFMAKHLGLDLSKIQNVSGEIDESFVRLLAKDQLKVFNADNPRPPARPNIVLIMVDDMGWADLGCYGGEVETPNIDRLAAEGTRHTQFYNNAKCTTTRASLTTGLYPRRDRGDTFLLRENMRTFGEVLKTAGYQTVLSGKWHLGRDSVRHPYYRGFDEYYGLLDGCSNFFDPSQPDPDYKGNRVRFFAQNETRITDFPDDYYTTDAFTDHAIETIKRFSKNEDPFFLHLTYTAPHYPLHAWPEDIAKYRGKFRQGWTKMREERYAKQIAMGLVDPETMPLSDFDARAYAWDTAQQDFEDLRMAVYAAMLDRVDQNIGRLRRTLEELGEAKNTLIIFLSDNGGCAEEPGGRDPELRIPGPKEDYVAVGPAWGWAQNAPFKCYKVWMHEGGICTPMIAWWPGKIPANRISSSVGHIIDIMPTFMELTGAQYPTEAIPLEGRSFWPALRGEDMPTPEQLCWEYSGNRAIRQGNWKLVWDKKIKDWELYNLAVDRTETQNLANQFPAKRDSMQADWMSWAKETGVPVKN
ncbi:MAG: sulfatase-like hydrolase/transferase [Bacteroidota bacterium]